MTATATEARIIPLQPKPEDRDHDLMLSRLTKALFDLSLLPTVEQLVDAAPAALCTLGFDRAMISRVEDAHWIVERVHSRWDPAAARAIAEEVRRVPPRITPALIELEMVRRRVPLLVLDVQRESRVHAQLAEVSRSYVAAPIMPEEEVVGFVHADRVDGRPLTATDREVVALFAQNFGTLIRNAWMRHRFEALEGALANLARSLGGVTSGCTEPSMGLVRPVPDPVDSTGRPTQQPLKASTLTGSPEVEELLSVREREVLRLMALGETNTRIASRLVISQGTVKSHVRHILRKLNAANRAEAVCRWLQQQPRHR